MQKRGGKPTAPKQTATNGFEEAQPAAATGAASFFCT